MVVVLLTKERRLSNKKDLRGPILIPYYITVIGTWHRLYIAAITVVHLTVNLP